MDQWLSSLSRGVVATAAIIIGTFLIVMFDPPRTVCDTQLEVFKESQIGFLFAGKTGSGASPQIDEMIDLCQRSNNPGGCFNFFENLKKLSTDLDQVPGRCADNVGSITEVKTAVLKSLDLMVRMAWGAREPASYVVRQGWMDSSDIALFCRLQGHAIRLYGQEGYHAFRDQLMNALPKQSALSREELWQRSIFSSRCGG